LIVSLSQIKSNERKLEKELWKEFEIEKPKILGALLDALSYGLANLESVSLMTIPRMADFAHWVVTAEPKLPWRPGEFMDIYEKNLNESMIAVFDSDFVAMALKDMMDHDKKWEGTATDLKNALEEHGDSILPEGYKKSKLWPKLPNGLSNKIRRLAPSLRTIGIEVDDPKINGKKLWRFKNLGFDQ
jgi:putative DNA primase/helicase